MAVAIASNEKRGLLDAIRRRPGLQTLVLIFPSLFWLVVFFVLPLVIVFVYSFLKRGPYGQLVWEFNLGNYARFFDPLYLKIFARSFKIAGITTVVCFLFGYPMAYWLATRPAKWRNTLLLLIMIPFWTNFLVRTYAWILILRDTGLVNNALSGLGLISEPLPLFGNDFAIIIGLVYGWCPDMVLPCYAAIERLFAGGSSTGPVCQRAADVPTDCVSVDPAWGRGRLHAGLHSLARRLRNPRSAGWGQIGHDWKCHPEPVP
jgi:ABC-type spermidine/putrescine transport system permease subunit I